MRSSLAPLVASGLLLFGCATPVNTVESDGQRRQLAVGHGWQLQLR